MCEIESRWTTRVRDAREDELWWRTQEAYCSTAFSFIWYCYHLRATLHSLRLCITGPGFHPQLPCLALSVTLA